MTDSLPQQHLRRKRRWLVPVVIGTVLLLLLGVVAGLVMSSSASLTIDEAESLFDRLTKKDGVDRQRTFDTSYSDWS